MRSVGLDLSREFPPRLAGALAVGALGLLLWLEKRRPLRRRTESKPRRDARNLAFATLSGFAVSRVEKPICLGLARLVHRKRWGLLKLVELPPWLEVLGALVLLDYTLWIWHVLTHKSRFLWRFHGVHHADLDLTATTALRFHFAEMILSTPWRAAQVVLLGASPLSFTTWQTATLVAILFHHSDVRMPRSVERWLCRLIVTPRMHGIHHSTVRGETDANWSTIFSWPDFLHGTIELDVPQDEITIGMTSPRDPAELTLPRLLVMPLRQATREQELLPARPRPRRGTPVRELRWKRIEATSASRASNTARSLRPPWTEDAHMANTGNMVSTLSDLVALDYDAIEAYDAAIHRLKDDVSRRQLSSFKADHERHVRDLTPYINRQGGSAPTSGDFKRFLTQGKVVLGSITGDDGILKAMKSNEDTTNQKYEEAVKTATETGASNDLVAALRRNLDDERRHRTWIETRLASLKAAA